MELNMNQIPIDFNLTFLIFDPTVLTGMSTSKIDPQVVDIWMPDMIWYNIIKLYLCKWH